MSHSPSARSMRTHTAHSAGHRRILRTVLRKPSNSVSLRTIITTVFGVLLPFCLIASGAPVHQRLAASSSFRKALVKLPVVDKQDIRFNRLSVGGEPFNKRVLAI